MFLIFDWAYRLAGKICVIIIKSSCPLPETTTSPPASLFRNPSFLRLWLAQIISSLGDSALALAMPVIVYNATGSKTAVGLTVIFETTPVVLFGLLGGVFADRWNRRRTMITVDVGRACAVLMLLGISQVRHFGAHELPLIYGVSFTVSSFSCFFSPARQALMNSLMPREQLLQASSLALTSMQIVQLLGPALGGFLLLWVHPRGVFVFDGATFLVSALLVLLVRNMTLPPTTRAARGMAGIWQDMREGLDYVRTSPVLRPALLLLATIVVTAFVYNTLLFPFVRDLWGGNGHQYGLLVSLSGVAVLATGLLASGPIKFAPPARLISMGLSVMGLALLVLAFSGNLYLGGAMMFVAGVGNTFANLGLVTLFQMTAPNHLMGRVNGTISLVNKLAMGRRGHSGDASGRPVSGQ